MQSASLSADAVVRGERKANRLSGEESVMDRVENEAKEEENCDWRGKERSAERKEDILIRVKEKREKNSCKGNNNMNILKNNKREIMNYKKKERMQMI